jgi:hypothetical protein
MNQTVRHNYPFIDQLVDTLHSDELNTIIKDKLRTDDDKSIFMMFIMMYFIINIKVQSIQKEQIKDVMAQFIGDYDKRRVCLQMFEPYFRQFFNESTKIENKGIQQILMNNNV